MATPAIIPLTQTQALVGAPAGLGQGQGAGLNQQALTGPANVQRTKKADGTDFKWWSGVWPGASGKLAKNMTKNAGTLAEQKDKAEMIHDFIVNPTSPLSALDSDSSTVAYILHVAGTNQVRILYGLAPIIENALLPGKPKGYRALMREPENEMAKFPAIMNLPEDLLQIQGVETPTKDHLEGKKETQAWKEWPFFKTGASADAMKADDKEVKQLMKIAAVPLFAVIDGFEGDLDAEEVHDRLEALNDDDPRAFLKTGMEFCRAALTQYGVSAKKITVAAGIFARIANQPDKLWAERKTFMLCPHMKVQVQAAGTAATGGMDQGMMALMTQLMTQQLQMVNQANTTGVQNTPTTAGPNAAAAEALLAKNSWEVKLGLSRSGLDNLLRFCGLIRSEEDRLPQLWTVLGEGLMTTADKQREIRRCLARNRVFDEVEAPVTVALLKVITKMDWCESEGEVNIANLMKGLSIFAMRPLTQEELTAYNDHDEALEKATATTIKDVSGGSSKRKHMVPGTVTGLEHYLKALVNVLHAISGGQNPLAHDLRAIIKKLQRWPSMARQGVTHDMIGAMMWVILMESRRFYMGVEVRKLPAFKSMMGCLESQSEFGMIGLPAELLPTMVEPIGKKRPRDVDKGKGGPAGGPPGSPTKQLKTYDNEGVRRAINPIIKNEMGVVLQAAAKQKMKLFQFCSAAGLRMWKVFPKHCGHLQLYGECHAKGCKYLHEALSDADAQLVVDNFKSVIDDPTLVTGQ